jgi:NAD-specific glutamate dehydrogenase
LRQATAHFIKTGESHAAARRFRAALRDAAAALEPKLFSIMPAYLVDWVKERRDAFKADGLTDAVAKKWV